MNCTEFKIRYNRSLDQRASDENLDDHLSTCEACRDYAGEMNDIVSEIHTIHRLPIPGYILQNLRSIPINHRRKRNAVLWKALCGLAGAVVYYVGSHAVPATEFIIEVGLVILTFTLTAVTLLKRSMLNL